LTLLRYLIYYILSTFFILLEKPGSPSITQLDIQTTSLRVKWTAPVDDGGSPITAYRMVILKGSTEIKNDNITDPGTTSWTAGDLTRTTNYTVKVFARNAVFEGRAAEKEVTTKYEGKKEMCAISCSLDFRVLKIGVQ